MRIFALLLISAISLASSSAFAASYQQNDGTIVDPIQAFDFATGNIAGNHPYSGNNLESFANLAGANLAAAALLNATLTNADLTNADLFGAILYGATLTNANLTNADLELANLQSADLESATLTNANLTGAYLIDANLIGADLTGAILIRAVGLGDTFGAALYDINTDFAGTFFDPVAKGWTLVPVPEPSTALLMGLGLAGLAARRR